MKRIVTQLSLLAATAILATGCVPVRHNLPPEQRMLEPGPGVGGPGPGVLGAPTMAPGMMGPGMMGPGMMGPGMAPGRMGPGMMGPGMGPGSMGPGMGMGMMGPRPSGPMPPGAIGAAPLEAMRRTSRGNRSWRSQPGRFQRLRTGRMCRFWRGLPQRSMLRWWPRVEYPARRWCVGRDANDGRWSTSNGSSHFRSTRWHADQIRRHWFGNF